MTTYNIGKYVMTLGIVLVVSYIGSKYRQSFQPMVNEEDELIRKYLLNESPLYGYNRPKLWIHTKYAENARKWLSFGSRKTTDLNQPILHYCIKSIIEQCGDDFSVILIDDNSFSRLLPQFDIDMIVISNTDKKRYRELALAKLLYLYGGMIVPNSTLCIKNMKKLYLGGISNNTPFICEHVNRTTDIFRKTHNRAFIPDSYFMGSKKGDKSMRDYIAFLEQKTTEPQLTDAEDIFVGFTSSYLSDRIKNNSFTLMGGELIGIKDIHKQPIVMEQLFEDEYLQLDPHCFAIYIDEDEILRRNKYNWFAVMTVRELLAQNFILIKYMKSAFIPSDISIEMDNYKENAVKTPIHALSI
jgi:hypothetical protein